MVDRCSSFLKDQREQLWRFVVLSGQNYLVRHALFVVISVFVVTYWWEEPLILVVGILWVPLAALMKPVA